MLQKIRIGTRLALAFAVFLLLIFALAAGGISGAKRLTERSAALYGDRTVPLGLLAVGGSLVTVDHRAGGSATWGAALLKTFAAPALGWGVARLMGLGAAETKILMILLATPTAIISYVMAMELKGDEAIASGSIVLSVLTSIVSLALVLAWF